MYPANVDSFCNHLSLVKVIDELIKDGDRQKYLGILQSGHIKFWEVRDKVMKAYRRRVRKVLERKNTIYNT